MTFEMEPSIKLKPLKLYLHVWVGSLELHEAQKEIAEECHGNE